MITILEQSGYDNPIAVKLLDEEKIRLIENYTSQRLLNIVKKSGYTTTDEFEFLPGHKVTLLALPSFVESFLEKSNRRQKNKHSSTVQATATTSKESENAIADQFFVYSEEEKAKLTNSLKSKIEKYLKKIDLNNFFISNDNISSIDTCINRAGKVVYKCSVKCPLCEDSTPCTFNNHWQISNLELHIREGHANGKKVPNSLKRNPTKKNASREPVPENAAEEIHTVNLAHVNELSILIDGDDDSSDKENTVSNSSFYIPLSESFKQAVSIKSVEPTTKEIV